jgi:Domain of unknown function (DUF4383)
MATQRTYAQWFCLIGGAVLLGRGIVGYVALDSSFDTPGEGWHHLIHLVSGLILIALARVADLARAAALGFGVFYTGLAVIGIVDGEEVLGLIEADAADKLFHTVLGLASLGAGLASGGARRGQAEDPQPAA